MIIIKQCENMDQKIFTQETITFLKELASNNNKEWFEENRRTYEQYVLYPLKQLAVDLGIVIQRIDDKIDISPKINITISKIYRDVRFSKDKSPFRTDQWISFKRPVKNWGNVPEFYFYFTPEEYQFGMGYYSASPENMEKFRYFISLNPARFKEIIDLYSVQDRFDLLGDSYKKYLPNQHPEEFQKWFQKKNLCMSSIKKIDRMFFSSELKDKIGKGFESNALLYQFLIESIS